MQPNTSLPPLDADVATLLGDIELARKNVQDHELRENVYPLMKAMILAFDERFRLSEKAVAELIAQDEESMIQPELGAILLGALEIGRQLCGAVEHNLARPQILKLIAEFRAAFDGLLPDLQEAILVEDEDPDDDDDDEEEDGDDEEDEETEEDEGVEA